MNKNIILVAVIALLIGGIGGFGLANHRASAYQCKMDDRGMMGENAKGERGGQKDHGMSDGSKMGNNQGMMGGMDGMDMMVRSEREFINGMIPHHEEAVKTAKEVIARGGTTPGIKALAENIVSAQEAEIVNMKSWYQTWYGEAYSNQDIYQPMMRELTKLSGAELDRTFLQDMIMHHMGAIMMARSVEPYIEHQEMTDLTKAIVDSQTAEIELMRDLLEDL